MRHGQSFIAGAFAKLHGRGFRPVSPRDSQQLEPIFSEVAGLLTKRSGAVALLCMLMMLVVAGTPLLAETDFFGNPVTPKPATPKPAPAAAVRPPGGATPAAKLDPIVGEWRWFDDQIVKFFADGRATAEKLGALSWVISPDPAAPRKYLITWPQLGATDTMTLSPDGTKLDGQNDHGTHVWATRAGPSPATPAPAATAQPVSAQARLATPVPSVKGAFYLSVEDSASIYVNGVKVYECGTGESHSGEVELKVGDRVVAHLRVEGYGRRFEMLFATTDKASVVSFRASDCKTVPDEELVDFTPEQWSKWAKGPKVDRRKLILPIKSYSDNLWGDLDNSTIACVITSKMFSQRPK